MGLFLVGTIIIISIGIIIYIIIIPFDKEYKALTIFVIFSLEIYILITIREWLLALILFGAISFVVSLGHESFRNRIVSIYQTTLVSSKKTSSKILKPLKKKGHKNSPLKNDKNGKNEKKKRALFWHARVKILQGTLEKEPIEKDKTNQNIKTWLQDYFSNSSRYCLELVSHKDFNWTFLMRARREAKARIIGEALLTRLLSIFPGVDAELEIEPVTRKKIYKNNVFWEIKLPKPPYLEKFTLINDFITIFHRSKQEIKVYIMWKKATPRKIEKIRYKIQRMKFKDEDEKKQYLKMWEEELFRVRIFVSYRIFEKDLRERELELQRIEGRIKSLTMSGRNLKKAAQIKRVTSGTYGNILRVNLFSGSYITPYCVDFDILKITPLVKPFTLESENVKYIPTDISNPDYILIGRHVNQGRKTEHRMLIQKNGFAQSLLVAGQQGTGKTYLLAQIVNEFHKKAPDIGILILNLGKGNQEGFYKTDKVIKFGSPDFHVPYFVNGHYLERSIQETATYLIASTGLKNIVEKNMVNVMQAFIDKKGKLPRSLKFLFKELIRYFDLHPYHVKFQTNILRALKNRVLSLLSNPVLEKAINLAPNDEIPQWFKDWRKGKKVFLDLSMCNIYEKRLITNAIFQLIRSRTPDIEVGKLQNIILIDEAHQILEKSITNNYDDDDYISRTQLEKIFNELLREFRSKGFSFILSDQTPSRLFDCVITLPSLKILFRVGHPCNTRLVGNQKEQDFLMLQKNRQALVLNGITGEKYIIETLDFSLPHQGPEGSIRSIDDQRFCEYCGTQVDSDAKFCDCCGKPFLFFD